MSIAKLLIESDADINHRDALGSTPLMNVADRGRENKFRICSLLCVFSSTT